MTTKDKIERPECVEDDHLIFLDVLQGSGVTNMFGAARYLVEHKDVSRRDSHAILSYWMESYDEREHPAAHYRSVYSRLEAVLQPRQQPLPIGGGHENHVEQATKLGLLPKSQAKERT